MTSFFQGSRVLVAAALGCGVFGLSETARADVSSWVYAGAGPAYLRSGGEDQWRSSLQLETGMGSAPGPLVFGLLGRVHTFFGDGTDVAMLFRGASRSFQQGGFGLAVDAGGYLRFWGEDSQGGVASLVLGMPWGITLSAGGGLGTNDRQFATMTLGLDFARLTVYRTHGTSWFPNPFASDEKGRGPRYPE